MGQEVVRALRNELARAGVCRHSAQAGLRPAGDRASLAAHGVMGADWSGHAGKAWTPAVSDAASMNTAEDGSNPG